MICWIKAAKAAPDLIRRAADSGYGEVPTYAHSIFGSILVNLAKMETNPEEKKSLLERALEHRKEAASITEELTPYLHWNRGASQGALSTDKVGPCRPC